MFAPPMDRDIESGLIARAQAGDREALDDLLRAHRARIWGVCRRILGSEVDAHDATQEACIAIMRHIAKFDGNAAFSTWIYRIATNASLDELRRRKRRPVAADHDVLDFTRTAHLGSSRPDVDRHVTDRIVVDQALARLPVEFRTAVVLRDLCDLDYGEIAQVLGIPIGTVRSRIARGRAALGSHLATDAAEDNSTTDVTDGSSEDGNRRGIAGRQKVQPHTHGRPTPSSDSDFVPQPDPSTS
jgi:RNA polymerase sigma-70 factor, ECF subfamily